MRELSQLKCVPCRSSDPPLDEVEVAALKPQVPDWNVVERNNVLHIEWIYKFKDFTQVLAFTSQVGELAKAEDHHLALLTE